MNRLTDKIVFVTGGSRGIGAGIVRRLAAEGADVAFTYTNSASQADALVAEVAGTGRRVLAIQADSGDTTAIRAAVAETVAQFGRIDVLVNNAGVFITGTVDDAGADLAAFDRQLAVNVAGVATTVRAAVPYIGEGGRIISIGSTGGSRAPFPGIADYVATKAAIAAYTRGWALDLGSKGITVNVIQPGNIDTEMNPATSDFAPAQAAGTALGRYGRVEEIAATVAFLASAEASYITGATINVDGGQSA
ncbi:SDR family oxidoreductase [Hymenobacter tibetensis]|uniref:SDR family oxidoreductase n=1 Tax=Hymenobacter tibetensis TaxID=497967 RepID=A0ABY4CT01_9BACT|nr:SDR family oxidoreductase [Hymenobacter tibetensis]UOG73386.1 SDR family oxidoreductase [Hymenobacter tibetensis]